MTSREIINYRLLSQHIVHSNCLTPFDVVSSMSAIQAQDYLSALWAVGLRLPSATEEDIEKEIEKRNIVRTWPMRGTLHFVAANDIRWMLRLLTPHVLNRSIANYKQEGLDDTVFKKCIKIVEKALQGEKALTRDGLYTALNAAKITTAGQRGLHIIGYLAQKEVICFGVRDGKQQTFVLLDEWLPGAKHIDREEALAIVTKKYFLSRGPATVNDFMTWSGLQEKDVKTGLDIVSTELSQATVKDKLYWFSKELRDHKILGVKRYLLPAFDEFLKGYADRSLSLDDQYSSKFILKNGLFNPLIVEKGRVIGTWKRTFVKDKVVIEAKLFDKSKVKPPNIIVAAKQYAAFLGKSLQILSED
jgi:hypothetical protein